MNECKSNTIQTPQNKLKQTTNVTPRNYKVVHKLQTPVVYKNSNAKSREATTVPYD